MPAYRSHLPFTQRIPLSRFPDCPLCDAQRYGISLTEYLSFGNGRQAVNEVAAHLAQQQPNLAVLFMSGYADRMVASDVLQARDVFLQKPFGPSNLAHKVRAVLDRKTDRQMQPFEHDADLQGTLTPDDLTDLPVEWLAALHDAARRSKDELIVELLEQLEPEQALLARILTRLAHNFRFDEIVMLTKRPDR